MDSNDTSSLVNFNEIQQQLAETFNPQTAKEKVKEIFANLLLGMAVPFFVERLREKLPADVFNKITELLKDPDNLGKNSLEFAKQMFNDKFLEPIKNELLEKIADQVPELRGIDLTTASLSDIKNTLAKGIIERMKSKLPSEISDRLPENFTQEDILNAVKTLGREQALQFAKNNLPPEAYTELERNESVLSDPARISDFVKGKLSDLQGQVEENFKNVKATVQSRIDEVKTAIKNKIDEATSEARNKISSLKQAQADARKTWNDTKGEFNDRFKSAQNKLDEFKRNNPNASQEDLQPLQDEVDRIRSAAEQAKQDFFNGQDDLTEQIGNAQDQVDQITRNLVEKVGNIRATISQRAEEATQRVQQQVSETRAAAEEIPQQVRTAASDAGNMFRVGETEADVPSLFDRVSSFVGEKTSQFKQFISRLGDQTPRQPDSAGNIQYESRYNVLQADEPEADFTERAITTVARNPALASYYGTELTPVDQLIDSANKVKILPYKASGRAPRTTKPSEPAQPEFTQEELRAAEQARISGQTTAPQKVLPTVQPEETAPTQTTVTTQQPVQEADLGETQAAPSAPAAPAAASEGEQIGEQAGKVVGKEAGAIVGEEGAEEGLFAGLMGGLSEVPVLGTLVDIAGILGSIFGAKALMKERAPPPPIISGAAYEPNL